jgi:hypothetical protein
MTTRLILVIQGFAPMPAQRVVVMGAMVVMLSSLPAEQYASERLIREASPMNSEAPVAVLLDAGAELVVTNDRLIVNVAFPLPEALVALIRQHQVEIIEAWQERAAIREFDGGFTTTEAERLAWIDLRTFTVTVSDHASCENADPNGF